MLRWDLIFGIGDMHTNQFWHTQQQQRTSLASICVFKRSVASDSARLAGLAARRFVHFRTRTAEGSLMEIRSEWNLRDVSPLGDSCTECSSRGRSPRQPTGIVGSYDLLSGSFVTVNVIRRRHRHGERSLGLARRLPSRLSFWVGRGLSVWVRNGDDFPAALAPARSPTAFVFANLEPMLFSTPHAFSMNNPESHHVECPPDA
jgi:hypothetical protein